MANELLKFRRGTYAQINAAERANGTIYVATDEKALYVDTATERIRIGDFIRVDSVEEITPPYSTSSLYYVEAANALLKYDGSAWKQVNGTDDLKEDLIELGNSVTELKSTVGSSTSGLVKDVNALKTAVGDEDSGLIKDVATNAFDIANLKKAVGMGDNGEVEGIGAAVAQLTEDLSELEVEVHGNDGNGGMVATLADHTSRIGTAETDIDNLETALGNYKTEVGQTYATKTELANEKSALQAEIDADVAAEAKLRSDEDTRLAGLISTAQSKANDAYTLASEKTTSAEVKTQIEAYGYATTGQVATAKNEAIEAAKTAGDSAYAVKGIESTVAGHTSELNTLTGDANTTGSVAEAKKAGDDALALIGDANSGLIKTVNAHEDYITNTLKGADTVVGSVAEAKKAGTDAMAKATSNAGDISELKSKVSGLETNSATKTELSNVQTALEQKIADDINAANAMDYKGGVASEDDLDEKSEVKSGDTYVATNAFEFTNGKTALPGDLIIATGTEVNGIIVAPVWEIVHTGYSASLEQTITTVASGDKNVIQLTSAVGNANNGQISFVAEAGSSAKVSVANNTVTIGMMWDDFPTT